MLFLDWLALYPLYCMDIYIINRTEMFPLYTQRKRNNFKRLNSAAVSAQDYLARPAQQALVGRAGNIFSKMV